MDAEGPVPQDEQQDELYERRTFTIDSGQEPMRIDKWLHLRIEGATRNKLQQAIEAGFVTVNGFGVKNNYKIKPGDHIIVLSFTNPEYTEIIPGAYSIGYRI
jgi:23S rRNA pseudouridine1911/1915/1917 synthase